MKFQDIFTCVTKTASMRDAIEGWTFESPANVASAFFDCRSKSKKYSSSNDIPVGMINDGSLDYHMYPTVLHALGDGWKLLAPPKVTQHTAEDDGRDLSECEWWLVRETEE